MEYTQPVSLYNEYLDYFGFREAPFSIAPNPDYLYMSDRHREALAHLLYGVNTDGGFVLISGEVGTGKTTLCRHLVNQLPDTINIAFVLNPRVSAAELLATICDELGVSYLGDASIKQMLDPLNHFLLEANEAGRKTVVIIDEAQNMDRDVLEQLRLLTNLETHQRKLLQVVLLGQPELLDLLSQPSLRQLLQRVTARYHLDGLNRDELPEYVEHRLRLAGGRGQVFSTGSLQEIYRLTGGIPRLVNLICDRALLGTYVQEKLTVDTGTVRRAATEVLGPKVRSPWLIPVAAVSSLVAISLGAYAWSLTTFDGPESINPVLPDTNLSTTKTTVQTHQKEQPHPENQDESQSWVVIPSPTTLQGRPSPSPVLTDPMATGYDRENDALSTLFSYSDTISATGNCNELQAYDCLTMVGTLDQVRRLNRPVVVRVEHEDADPRYLVITGLTDTIELSGGQFVGPDDLLRYWDGQFTLLWQPPAAFERVIRPGDTHPTLAQVRAQLMDQDRINVRDVTRYDATLVAAVRRFQLRHGLKPDGLIGVQTLILLANQSDRSFHTLDHRLDSSLPATQSVIQVGDS